MALFTRGRPHPELAVPGADEVAAALVTGDDGADLRRGGGEFLRAPIDAGPASGAAEKLGQLDGANLLLLARQMAVCEGDKAVSLRSHHRHRR